MAIIKIGPPLAGVRGTIGGIVFSENKSSTYAKIWTATSNPRTQKQTIERGYLGMMPHEWGALNDAQRADWRDFADDPAQELTNSLGDAYFASGFNWFCKCSIRLLRIGRTPLPDAPDQARPAAPTIDDFRVCVAGAESDLCTCGVATANSEMFGQEATKAFDDNLGTFWLTDLEPPPGWIRYDLCDPANVNHYRIYPPPGELTASPTEWEFRVFDDGGWQAIHSVTGVTFVAGVWQDFHCPNPWHATDYLLNITANQGSGDFVGIGEMEMFLGDEGKSVICYPEDNFDNAPAYDLVLHISMGRGAGQWVQYPNYMEIIVNDAPGRWFQLFQAELESVFGTIQPDRAWFCRLYRQTREGLRSAAATDRTITIEA